MAYVPFMDEEQNKQNVAATPEIGTSSALPTTGGGSGSAPSTVAGNPGAQPSQPGKQGFANLNQYLTANKEQAPQVAGAVASNLGKQYAGLQGSIDTAANQAGEAVKGGSTAYDPNLVNNALSDPTQFVGNPENLANWQKQYSAAYTGPTAFETSAGYGKAADAANKAGQTAQLGNTGGGYTQLLNQIEKNPTAGKTALDKSLIQYDPNSAQTVQTALSPFKGIGDYLKGKSTEIGQQAAEAAKTTGETAAKTKEAATGAEKTFEQSIADKTAATKKATQDEYAAIQKAFANPAVYGQDASKFGNQMQEHMANLEKYGTTAAPDARAVLTNLSAWGPKNLGPTAPTALNKYATLANQDLITNATSSSADDYAKADALAKLGAAQSPYLNAGEKSLAGTAPKSFFDTKAAGQSFLPGLADALPKVEQYRDTHPNSGFQAVVDENKRWQQILQGIK